MTMKDVINGTEPWWAKLVLTVGAPMALLGLVVYILVTGLAANAASAAQNSQQVLEVLDAHHKLAEQQARTSKRIEYFFWVQCIRGSNSESDRALCGPNPRSRQDD